MARLTPAEKQQRYRDRKRNAKVTPDGNGVIQPSPFVTDGLPGGDLPGAPVESYGAPKPGFADLPSGVQAEIEKHCAENNNGERAASHSRAAMTERALRYLGTAKALNLLLNPKESR